MVNWKVIVVAIIAIIASGFIWDMIVTSQLQNCENNVEAIQNNPDSSVAKLCEQWGFEIDQNESNLP